MANGSIKKLKTNSDMLDISWKKLYRETRKISAPFQLTLTNPDGVLYCNQIVRVVPRKRLVVFAMWNDKPVVAKLFFERSRAQHHFERELKGVQAMIDSGVPTPKLLYHGQLQKNRIQILLFERIIGASSLEDRWQARSSADELTPLMQAFTIELATQHVVGVVQNDLHFKNFLIKGKQIYSLDGGSVTYFHQPLPKKPSLDHLGLFFSQLGAGTESLRKIVFATYVKARGWLVKPADVRYLEHSIEKWNTLRWSRHQSKIVRPCTAFEKISRFRSLAMYDRAHQSAELLNFLANPESVFSQPTTEILKAGRSSTVAKIQLNNRVYVIKRYNIKTIWHRLRRCLRSTRAVKSWRLGHLLTLFGVQTAKPIAFVENRFCGLRGKSYYLMEVVEGVDLRDYFAQYDVQSKQYEIMAARVVDLLKSLSDIHLSHGDLKATNIYVENNRPVLLDLDGVVEHRNEQGTKRAYQNEIKRFMRNWENQPAIHALFQHLIM